MRIDLHTHSNVSDGTQTPTELIEEAAASGLDVIGLTTSEARAGGSVFEHHHFPDKYLKDESLDELTAVASEAMTFFWRMRSCVTDDIAGAAVE